MWGRRTAYDLPQQVQIHLGAGSTAALNRLLVVVTCSSSQDFAGVKLAHPVASPRSWSKTPRPGSVPQADTTPFGYLNIVCAETSIGDGG